MVLAKSCGITLVCASLALQLDCSEASLVQRLREWCYEAPAKRGAKRRALEVNTGFAPLVRWVLSRWPTDEPRLALALDATTLKQRFTVLTMSVLYRGCAIPVAWKVVGAEEQGSWRPHWISLLAGVQGSVPPGWIVVVMTDRGLYARWLYESIRSALLASLHAHQSAGPFSSAGSTSVSEPGDRCSQAGKRMVWPSGLF